jgi:hypothetical protein
MKRILVESARSENAQMRVQPFSDRRPDHFPWADRNLGQIENGEWASLRFEDGDFNTQSHLDTEAREKWFYQAIGASQAMFRRDTHAGSRYWLGLRDQRGTYLDGGKS